VICFASIAGHAAPTPADEVLAALDDPLAPDLPGRVLKAGDPELDNPGAAYGLSKLGVIRLARRTGVAWGPRGVRVYSLSPGIIDTPMGRQEFEHQPFMADMLELTPIKRLGRPEEIAAVVSFLCSPDASYMTAGDVVVDGGFLGAVGSVRP
jgi:NAD(P)-dependent dehydrogenase (short-subunit alcohol dehydrogenase family)